VVATQFSFDLFSFGLLGPFVSGQNVLFQTLINFKVETLTFQSLLFPFFVLPRLHKPRIRWRAPSGEEGAAAPRSSGDPAGTGAGGQHMGCMCDDMAKTPGCSTACSARAGAPKISTALRRYTPMVRVTRGILRWSESPVAEHSAPLHHIISYARTMCTVRSMSPRLHTGAKTLASRLHGLQGFRVCMHI
jgi:hypothetical protein